MSVSWLVGSYSDCHNILKRQRSHTVDAPIGALVKLYVYYADIRGWNKVVRSLFLSPQPKFETYSMYTEKNFKTLDSTLEKLIAVMPEKGLNLESQILERKVDKVANVNIKQ